MSSGPDSDYLPNLRIDGAKITDIISDCSKKKELDDFAKYAVDGECRIARVSDDGNAMFFAGYFKTMDALCLINSIINQYAQENAILGVYSSTDTKTSTLQQAYLKIGFVANEYHYWLLLDCSKTFSQNDADTLKAIFPSPQ